MNGYNLLELCLRDILRGINPSKDDWSVRFQIISDIRAAVGAVECLRGATVEPFGSFVSNLFTRWGDLDISVEFQNGSYISIPGRKHKQTLLKDVLKALRKKGGFNKLQYIANARVPILKFEGIYNVSCDISINNLSGQMKSKMLFWINEIDGRFRDLVLLVKEWAKNHHINDSKSGTLNSYSLSLLVVFHLQTLVPPILPPLKEIYPTNMLDDLAGVRAVAEKHIEDTCALNINRIKSDKSRLINRSPLSSLFISFLGKYIDRDFISLPSQFADICSRASTQGVSPFSGQLEDIDSNMRWLPKTYALFVEDPFEQPANTARTVSSRQLLRILEEIQATHSILVSSNQNQASVFSTMVRPQILHLVTRAPVTTQPVSRPFDNRNGHKPQPERRQAPRQTGHAAPNRRMDKRENGATNGTMHASASQNQQTSKQTVHAAPNRRMDKRENGATNGTMHASTSQNQQTSKQTVPAAPNRRMDKREIGATNGTMHLSTSQNQQIWRPRFDA